MIALPLSPRVALLPHHGPMTAVPFLFPLPVPSIASTVSHPVLVVTFTTVVSSEHLPAEVDEDFVYVCYISAMCQYLRSSLGMKDKKKKKKKDILLVLALAS